MLLLASHWHIQLPPTRDPNHLDSIMCFTKVLSRHLQHLPAHNSNTIDTNFQTPTVRAFLNTCAEILQHRLNSILQVPVSLKKLTTWNVTSWSPRLPSNQNKNRFIAKLLRRGPVLLQETKWTLEAATFLQQHWTGIATASSPAQSTDTGKQGGVAILLPIGWILHEVHEILPGYALAVKAEIQSQTIWLASIYFPIAGTQQLLNQISSQLARLIKDQPIFIGGDLNHADERFLTTWNHLLSKCRIEDIEPTLETFFSPQSNSALDRILAPTELLDGAHANLNTYLVNFYPKYGHQAKQLSLRFTPKLRPHPDSTTHDTIPTSAFIQPISIHSNTAIIAALATLRRAFEENPHINKVSDKGLYAKALIWGWWRRHQSSYQEVRSFRVFYRKLIGPLPFIRATNRQIELLAKAAEQPVSCLHPYPLEADGTRKLPKTLVITLLQKAEEAESKISAISYTAAPPGPLITAIAQNKIWANLKALVPKGEHYNGPILDAQGYKVTSAKEYDQALLATRSFWFQPPTNYDSRWLPTLNRYQEQMEPWPSFDTPSHNCILKHLVHTKDSSPGPDGIPYAAWRLSPQFSTALIINEFKRLKSGLLPTPTQVGVWIPKASPGPTADHFRPLGMPDTLDRLMDGAAAAALFQHTATLFHPAQTMLNCFKEPQSAAIQVQTELDSLDPTAALFMDLAKAFECVNAHWILHLLFIRQAPIWVIQLAQRMFFQRQIRHKVQGRLLPPRVVHSGVDMGRSTSVFFFCLAMDPIFVSLNRIPGVINVFGYVDDTTIVGRTDPHLDWPRAVMQEVSNWHSAGIRMDGHHCWRIGLTCDYLTPYDTLVSTDTIHPPPEWITPHGFPTLTTTKFSLPHEVPYLVVARGTSALIVEWPTYIAMLNGDSNLLGVLAAVQCNCRSKTKILTNAFLTTHHIQELDISGLGAQCLSDDTTNLGLIVYGGISLDEDGNTIMIPPQKGLPYFASKALRKMDRRKHRIMASPHSIKYNITFCNMYCNSGFAYVKSSSAILPTDLNQIYNTYVDILLRRPWFDKLHLPGIFRWLDIGPLLDPSIMQAVAVFGYFHRWGGQLGSLAPSKQRYRQHVFRIWKYWCSKLSVTEAMHLLSIEKVAEPNMPSKFNECFKKYAVLRQLQAAKQHLLTRIQNNGWPGGISTSFIEELALLPRLSVGQVPRFSLFRWSIGEDADYWLPLRGVTSRKRDCCLCGAEAKQYPFGPAYGALCSQCWLPSTDATFIHIPCEQYVSIQDLLGFEIPKLASPLLTVLTRAEYTPFANEPPLKCFLCNTCTNSIDHWCQFCPVPAIAFNLLHRLPHWQHLHYGVTSEPIQVTVKTLLIFHLRRLLREIGALDKTPQLQRSATILQHATELAQRIYSSMPAKYTYKLRPQTSTQSDLCLTPAAIVASHIPQTQLESLLLPKRALITTGPSSKGQVIATLDPHDPRLSLLRFQYHFSPTQTPTASLEVIQCATCGSLHIQLHALCNLTPGDILMLGIDNIAVEYIIQFDGSAHYRQQKGGAGVCVIQVTQYSVNIHSWEAFSLPDCPDNIIAEAEACRRALRKAYSLVTSCSPPAPQSIYLQGDILPLIRFLNNQGRIRRLDVLAIMEDCLRLTSFLAPFVVNHYLPRECNKLADYFAGYASRWLLDNPTSHHYGTLSAEPPYKLLQQLGFQSRESMRRNTNIIFTEQPQFSYQGLRAHLASHSAHGDAWCLYRSHFQSSSYTVKYHRTSQDDMGRIYPTTFAAQALPRSLRLVLFASTHSEIDMWGAHYEIVRRFGPPNELNHVTQIREWLFQTLTPLAGAILTLEFCKLWPLVVINSQTPGAALSYLEWQLRCTPPLPITRFANNLHNLAQALAATPPQWLPPRIHNNPKGRVFHVCEHIEYELTMAMLTHLQQQHTFQSCVWLHDGFWLAPPPTDDQLQASNQHIINTYGLSQTEPPLFRSSPLVTFITGRDTICSNSSDSASNLVGTLKAIKKRPHSAPSTQELAQQVERLGKRQKTSFAFLTHVRSYPYNAQPTPPHKRRRNWSPLADPPHLLDAHLRASW